MKNKIIETIQIIDGVRVSMPDCANKSSLSVAINKLNAILEKQEKLRNIGKTKFNPNDYMVLNPDIFKLDENQIAVGIKNHTLAGKPCLMEYEYEGNVYKRLHSKFIPIRLVGKVCSIQIYELKK